MHRSRFVDHVAHAVSVCVLLGPATAGAQQPPGAPPPPPARYQPPPGRYQPPPPRYGQPGSPPPHQPYAYPSPPPLAAPVTPEREAHAPELSLWTGARLSYVGFGFSFYENEVGEPETTGNYLGDGVAPQLDLGARIAYRYIPYVFWEHGFMGQGHRFDGSPARSSTDVFGIGLRYVSGDVDSVGFLADLSIGKRAVTVSGGSQSYSMSGLELVRLGLGVEIRVATLFALTPLFSIASGALNDSEGDLPFACAPSCVDGAQGPTYTNGQAIRTSRAYVVLSLGLGVHFDVFGE